MTIIQDSINNNINGNANTNIDTLTGAVLYESNTSDTLPTTSVYYFDIIEEHTVNVQNQITDNYLEDNTAVQDHVAQAPISITLRGLIGDKVFTPADAAETYDQLLQTAKRHTAPNTFDKLHDLEQLYPPISNLEQIAWNAYDMVSSTVKRYVGIYQSFFNSNNPLNAFNGTTSEDAKETRLQEVYRKLLILRSNTTSLIVETPFNTLQDMYIESISFHQGNENYVGDLEINLKQVRFAQVSTTAPDPNVINKYNAWARAKEENHGLAQGKRKSIGARLYDGDTNIFQL